MADSRVLVTGAKGTLGQDLIASLAMHSSVEVTGTTSAELNLAWEKDKIQAVLDDSKPDIIINTAAFTAVDACETEFEKALAVNAYGPKILAEWCLEQEKYLVHISTDYVFDGTKGAPYTTLDVPHPINRYGESKWAAETAILQVLPQAAVVRTSWLFGSGGKNFVPFVIDKALGQTPVNIAMDQWGTPTWTQNLCKMLLEIIAERPSGIFHGSCQGSVSRYEQARHLCHCLGVSEDFMTPVPTAFFNFPAQRPQNTTLQSSFSKAPAWQEATEQFLVTLAIQGKVNV